MEEQRINALAKHLKIDSDEIEVSSYNDQLLEVGSDEYLVMTDDEADFEWEEQLDRYLEDCVLPELPDSLQNYFDDEAWKRDARMDGRGHSIATYDSSENNIAIDGETFYIFRTN